MHNGTQDATTQFPKKACPRHGKDSLCGADDAFHRTGTLAWTDPSPATSPQFSARFRSHSNPNTCVSCKRREPLTDWRVFQTDNAARTFLLRPTASQSCLPVDSTLGLRFEKLGTLITRSIMSTQKYSTIVYLRHTVASAANWVDRCTHRHVI
ncbi:hypothetical protein GQ44DRAFT_461110 [Phaeosphaeriaceae sp. PMI808]|nr:hypothetical protein GQ44DRAFT_461110 [Phaeosphaeriaceae sp. PMI808]